MKSTTLVSLVLSGLAAAGLAHAGTVASEAAAPAPASSSDWTFRIEPYGWLTGLDGTTGVGPLAADIDLSFSDIFDQIEMAAAMQVEARNGRWGIIADGFYAQLGASGNPPGAFYSDVEVEMKQFIGELAVAYRVWESDKGFVDVYGGVRYNNLSLDLDGTLDAAGIGNAGVAASGRIVGGIDERAQAIVDPKVAAYQSAAAAKRAVIEAQVTSAIEAEAEGRVKRDLEKQLIQIRRDGGLSVREIAGNRIVRAVKAQRLELARATAQLEVAKLRAKVDSSLQGKVTRAKSRVNRAEESLASAISTQLQNRLPTSTTADKDWADPILGVRGQWNFTDKWFAAGRSDIGGFGVASDLVWSVQATVGYQFTETVSAEIGYRYLDTDYSDGDFIYDVAEHGVYTGLNIRF